MKRKDREAVFNKYGGRCAYCGCELQKGWHVDHVEAVVREMKYDPVNRRLVQTGKFHRPENHNADNLMPACPACNINKNSSTLEGWRHSISHGVDSLNKRYPQYKFAKKFGLVEETGKPVVFYFETHDPHPSETPKK